MADLKELARQASTLEADMEEWDRRRARKKAKLDLQTMQSSKYYWADCPGQAIGPEVFNQCQHILLSQQELDTHQQTLAAAKSSIRGPHWGDWSQHALVKKGFKVLDKPAIVAVVEPNGRRAVQFVFLPKIPSHLAMANLANQLFDKHGKPDQVTWEYRRRRQKTQTLYLTRFGNLARF